MLTAIRTCGKVFSAVSGQAEDTINAMPPTKVWLVVVIDTSPSASVAMIIPVVVPLLVPARSMSTRILRKPRALSCPAQIVMVKFYKEWCGYCTLLPIAVLNLHCPQVVLESLVLLVPVT